MELKYKNPLAKQLLALKATIGMPIIKATGLGIHPVFMYNIHFEGYNHIFKVVCNDNQKIVPLLDDNGMVTNSYANGAFWVNYTFRVGGTKLDQNTYEQGLVPYLHYFGNENGLQNANYTIYVKEIETTTKWQKDFLRKQIAKPWQPAGTCNVLPTAATFIWNTQMKAIFEAEKTNPKRNPK
jgi:hypothetical protein